jgi:uncharacterized protein
MPKSLPVIKPSSVTLMIKPVGALCNLDCEYCYYLPTKSVYDGHEHKMRLDVLESIFAGYLPLAADEVTICWQGGEPTLAGLKFFEKAIEFQHKHKREGQRVWNALQTNGTLLDDEWCKLLRENKFLVGISVDGPPHFHDHYRVTNKGEGSHDQVMRGLRLLQKYDVEYNILCVLNQRNVGHPDEVFNYLLNLGSRWLQFIPEVVFEKDPETGDNVLADHCPGPLDYGKFMTRVFDLWFERSRQRVSVRMFDAVLNKLVLGQMPLCILDGNCSGQMTIEHNGDVYGCDHFVERRWQLAQIGEEDWTNAFNADGTENVGLTIHGGGYAPNDAHAGKDIATADDVDSRYGQQTATMVIDDLDTAWFNRADASRLTTFSQRKQQNGLPEKCQTCDYQPFCYGGCPEHRPHGGDRIEATILCEGYIYFYNRCMERLEWLAGYLKMGQQPPAVQRNVDAGAATDSAIGRRQPVPAGQKVNRNAPCPCGSGRKYKQCCGR